MLYDLELRYLEYQERLNQSRKSYLVHSLPHRRLRLPSWQQIRALLFL